MHFSTLAARCALAASLCLTGTNAAPASSGSMAVRSYQSDGSVRIAERDIDNIQDAAPEDMLQEIDDILGDIQVEARNHFQETCKPILA